MKRIATALLLVLLVACGGGTSTHKIDGAVDLLHTPDMIVAFPDWSSAGPCSGLGGYSDLREGAQVLIVNVAGATIASAQLGKGAWKDGDPRVVCRFAFSADVAASDFYHVKISHRDGPTYSQADLQRDGWKAVLTIG